MALIDSSPDLGDSRDEQTKQLDAIAEAMLSFGSKMDAYLDRERERGQTNTQTVIHKSEGIQPWVIASVVTGFMSIFLMILVTVILLYMMKNTNDDVRDLKAWNQVHTKQIAELKPKP